MTNLIATIENCHDCPFRIFLSSHNAGCFATKLAGTPLKVPTRFQYGKIPDDKPKWCPLDKLYITVIDD